MDELSGEVDLWKEIIKYFYVMWLYYRKVFFSVKFLKLFEVLSCSNQKMKL